MLIFLLLFCYYVCTFLVRFNSSRFLEKKTEYSWRKTERFILKIFTDENGPRLETPDEETVPLDDEQTTVMPGKLLTSKTMMDDEKKKCLDLIAL